MGRILDKSTYPLKENPTLSDYVIGTDSEDNFKTVNFPVGNFQGDSSIIQNNRFKLIKTGTASTPAEVASLINSFSTQIEVLDDEIPIFLSIQPPSSLDEPTSIIYWGLLGLGKGIYGLGGNTTVSISQPFIIDSRPIQNGTELDDIPNSFVIDFGEIPDSNIDTFVDAINNSEDTYIIQAGTNWYFKGTVSGDLVIYGWKGENGTYGDGGTTTVQDDLFLLEDNTGVNTQPSIKPTGLEKINEGNGDAWRLIGRNPSLYANAGLNSIDFATSSDGGEGYGASGQNSFSVGEDNIASGYGSITMGSVLSATGVLSTVFGFLNSTDGYASFMQGYNNTESTSTGFAMTVGHSNVQGTNAGLMSGVALQSSNGVGTFICGAANEAVSGFNNGTSSDQPIIIVGNGTHTTPTGSSWTALTRSNLLVGYRKGEVVLPSTTIAVIDAESTGKQIVTKEWVEAQNYLNIGATGRLVVQESGYAIAGRDTTLFGNVGLNSVDFSTSNTVSNVHGAIGQNVFVTGLNNIAAGQYSTVLGGYSNTAEGFASFVAGVENRGDGVATFVAGVDNIVTASGAYSTLFGTENRATTNYAFIAGVGNRTSSNVETIFGTYATTYIGNTTSGSSKDPLDRIFCIGNGTTDATRSDAFTVLANGRVGIDISNFEADGGNEKLVVNGNVRAETLKLVNVPTYADDAAAGVAGLATNTVYKTATGELRIKL